MSPKKKKNSNQQQIQHSKESKRKNLDAKSNVKTNIFSIENKIKNRIVTC